MGWIKPVVLIQLEASECKKEDSLKTRWKRSRSLAAKEPPQISSLVRKLLKWVDLFRKKIKQKVCEIAEIIRYLPLRGRQLF